MPLSQALYHQQRYSESRGEHTEIHAQPGRPHPTHLGWFEPPGLSPPPSKSNKENMGVFLPNRTSGPEQETSLHTKCGCCQRWNPERDRMGTSRGTPGRPPSRRHRRPRGDVRTVSSGKWLAISGLDGRGQVYTLGGAFSTLGLWGVPSRRTRCGCTSSVSPRDPADLGQVSWGGGALQGAV